MRVNKTRVRVSIVIPAYNEERHLAACLEAIAVQTVAPFEVIVVDNNSTDKTAQITREFPFVIVVDEPEQGIVYARNAGFNVAKGDVIGRIDADIQLPPNWVEHVQHFYAGGRHKNQAWTGAGFFYNVPFPRFLSWVYSIFAFKLNQLLVGHPTLWGSNMAITRDQWRRVHQAPCLRTDIHEDLDLAIHLREAGFGITYDPAVKTRAELRPVHYERHELWKYLMRWPLTLRAHRVKTWPICWFFGVLVLYIAATMLAWLDKAVRHFGKRDLTTRRG